MIYPANVDPEYIRKTRTPLRLLISRFCVTRSLAGMALQWRHNERDGVSNHQHRHCLLNRLFKAQIKENIKAPRHWPLWGEFTGRRWIPRTKGQ